MNIQKIIDNILDKKYKLRQLPDIKFDKKGVVIGEYYGECPICKNKDNLVYNKNGIWCCRWCYYGKKRNK